jgi:hypothetical protein
MLAQIDFQTLEQETGLRFAGQPIGAIITDLLPYIFAGAGILLLLYLLFGGFQWMTSAGDPKKVEGARNKIMHALIGFVIIFAAFWLVQLAGRVLGLEEITNIFGIRRIENLGSPRMPGL